MIRSFDKNDEPQLLEILELLTPKYFAETEKEDFKIYLEKFREQYFVFEFEKKIVACGGINFFPKEKKARISWDLVHPNFHGKGIGKQLVNYRINEILKISEIKIIEVRTSQLVFPFYEKQGFKLENIKKDYWSKGLDLYLMCLKVNASF